MTKMLLPLFLVTFVVCAFTGGCVYFLLYQSSLEEKEKYTIAVTEDTSNPYIELGLNALQTLDSSKYIFDLIQTTEEDARSLLRKKKIVAYIVIPEGFVEKVEYGDNSSQVTYVTHLGQRGIVDLFKDQIAEIVSTLLIHAQSGIFAMENIVYSSPEKGNLYNYNIDMNVQYINWALNRTKLCSVKELGISGGISYSTYYLFSILVLFIFMTGLTFTMYFTGRNQPICKRLAVNGMEAFKQVSAEYLVYFSVILLFTVFISCLVGCLSESGLFSIEEISYLNFVMKILYIVMSLIPALMIFTALHFLFYELSSNSISSVIIQFTLILFFSYLGGFFYPISFFPKSIQTVCRILPAGLALDFCHSIIAGNFKLFEFAMTAFYAITAFLLAVLFRSAKMER